MKNVFRESIIDISFSEGAVILKVYCILFYMILFRTFISVTDLNSLLFFNQTFKFQFMKQDGKSFPELLTPIVLGLQRNIGRCGVSSGGMVVFGLRGVPLQRCQGDPGIPVFALGVVQIMLLDVLLDKVRHQVADALAPPECSADLGG